MTTFFRKLLLWLPATVWASLIFFLSGRPTGPQPAWWFANADKVIHAGIFGILALLVFLALRVAHGLFPRSAAILAFLAAISYGVSDEIHQRFSPGRNSDPWDAVADTVGAAIVFPVAAALSRPKEVTT